MVTKHEQSGLLGVFPQDRMCSFFESAVTLIRDLTALDSVLENFEHDELDGDDVFEYLEGLNLDISSVCVVADCMTSVNAALNRYLSQIGGVLRDVYDEIQKIPDYGLDPTVEMSQSIREKLFTVIGGLTYYLMQEFRLADTFAGLGNSDFPIDEIFYRYVQGTSLDVYGFQREMERSSERYKYKLAFFDEHADLELDFMKAVGPWYALIPEECLTLQVVTDLIDGKYSAEDFVNSVNPDDRFNIEGVG